MSDFNGTKINSILWFRTDSIGDTILANSMLPHIKARFNDASITVVCQSHVSELYEPCPFINEIRCYEVKRIHLDEDYRANIAASLSSVKADLSLNSIYSRDPLGDALSTIPDVKIRVALEGDLSNITEEFRQRDNERYQLVIPCSQGHVSELERHREFLKGLGIEATNLTPLIWLKGEDDQFGEMVFRDNSLRTDSTVGLLASSQWDIKIYERFVEGLSKSFQALGLTVIALGTKEEYARTQSVLDGLGVRSLNLCGQTTLRQTAAILRRCRIAVGNDTGNMHIACAVGIPNVVVLGGGHFGRFFPYSRLTSVVCKPMECYGCAWKCKYDRSYCVKDVAPSIIKIAFEEAISSESNKPRIYFSDADIPAKQLLASFIKPEMSEFRAVGEG